MAATTTTLQALRAPDASHWYTRDGYSCHQVRARNGSWRPTTLRDAKKHDLLPSVTNILGIVAKPELSAWRQSQLIRMALDHPLGDGADIESHVSQLMADHDAEFRAAADLGTAHHEAIEQAVSFLEGYAAHYEWPDCVPDATVAAFCDWYRHEGMHAAAVEERVVGDGYAGTIDWWGEWAGRPAIIDWKTTKSEPGRTMRAWPSYGAQIAAYAEACPMSRGVDNVMLVNVLISTTEPGRIEVWDWTSQRAEMWAAFQAAFALWCGPLGKGWTPGR